MKRRMKTLSWRKDLKLNAARSSSGTHTVTWDFAKNILVTSGSRVKRFLTVTKDIVTFNEEEDEDTLVEEGPLIETRHGVSRGHRPPLDSPEKHVDKRVPREVCFDWGDVEVEKDIVTLNEEVDEDSLVEQ